MSRPPVSVVLAFLCSVSFLSARSAAASTSAAPSGDQEQRTLIECVIENQLSGATCKAVVQRQNSDPNQDLQQACSMLEAGKNMMSLVGCTPADYDKLHKVICEYDNNGNATSCVTTTSTTTTETTTTTTATTTTPTPTLKTTFSTTTPLAATTTTPIIRTTTPTPSTAPTTTTTSTTTRAVTAAVIDEEKQRDLILCVIENQLSGATCKAVVQSQNSDPNQDLQQACSMLEAVENMMSLIGCTPADYDKLHKVICEYTVNDCVTSTSTATTETTTAATTTKPTATPTTLTTTTNPSTTTTTAPKHTTAPATTNPLTTTTAPYPIIVPTTTTTSTYTTTSTAISTLTTTSTPATTTTRSATITTPTTTTTFIPTTTVATASAMSDGQKQRELILCVIENQLSNEQCKSIVKSQNTNPNQDLQQACSMLEARKNMISVINCTLNDYNKLHKVICEYTTDMDTSCITNTPTPPTSTTATTAIGVTSAPTLTTTSCTTTADMTDDQKQRALIECVIENDLSSEKCKSVVKSQNSDPNKDLQQACSELEAGKSMMSLVGCTMGDYDKLHKVICEYRTAVSTTPTMTNEEKQRELILCVIENHLSNEQCKSVVKAQNTNPNQDLQQACSMLETGKNMMSLINCTMDDYNKLHKVICEYNSTGRDISCTTNTGPATTPVPITVKTTAAPPPTITEKEQIEKVQAMIQNELSSTQCKDTLQLQLTPDLTLARGCELLERYQSAFPLIDCTTDDYSKLHKEVCEFRVDSGTSCDPDLPRWRDDVRDIMDNHLSALCGPLVKEQADETASPEETCQKLLENKDQIMGICKQDDYDTMHDILCRYENRSREMMKERLRNVLQKAGSSCEDSVYAIVNYDRGGECERITASRNTLLSNRFCTEAQVTEIEDNVCNKGSVCRTVSTNLDSRPDRVETVINVLSENCQRTMGPGIQELSEPSEKSCKILEDRKDHLISSGACTEIDYVRLYLVVCGDRDSEGDQQIEKVVSFLSNNLTISCHDRLWPKVESLAHGLETMCEDLKTKGPILLRVGDCSKTEYNTLDSLLCPRPMSEQEKAQRAEIDRVVAEDVTPSCKSTMEGQIESQRNNPLKESCGMIRDSKDILGSFCTSEDIVKLENAICGEGGDSASVLAGSLLAIVPLCVMSWVSTYVLM